MDHMREINLIHAVVDRMLLELAEIDSDAFSAESATVRIVSKTNYQYDVKLTRHGEVSVQPQRPQRRG